VPEFDTESPARLRSKFDPMTIARTVDVQLTIRIYRDGAMSVEGPTGDPAFCKQMLDEAYAAILRNQKSDHPALIVPGHDVDTKPQESYQ